MSRTFLTDIFVGAFRVLHLGDIPAPPVRFSVDGLAMVQTGAHRIYNDTGRTLTIKSVRASAGTAPTGATLIVDVNVDGTTIMTGTKAVIATSTNTIKQTTLSTTTIADGSYFTCDIDQIGSTIAGGNIVVEVMLAG